MSDDDDALSQLIPELIIVSAEDYDFLLEMIENPPEPNEALIKLLKG